MFTASILPRVPPRRCGGEMMADKPLKSLNGKKFEGVLAEPIDHGFFMPVLLPDDPAWPLYLRAIKLKKRELRLDKMQALARHLDIDIEQFNLTDPSNGFGLMMFYAVIAETLASHMIPGFMEKPRGKHPREIVRLIRECVDAMKANGKAGSDLEACRDFLKHETPELARPRNKSELEQKAKSLRNLVARDRASVERAEKAVHKKPGLRVVK
jgi:hypothetical protein